MYSATKPLFCCVFFSTSHTASAVSNGVNLQVKWSRNVCHNAPNGMLPCCISSKYGGAHVCASPSIRLRTAWIHCSGTMVQVFVATSNVFRGAPCKVAKLWNAARKCLASALPPLPSHGFGHCYGRLAVVSDLDDGGFALNVDKELRGSAVL
jgi:hypothetical protein